MAVNISSKIFTYLKIYKFGNGRYMTDINTFMDSEEISSRSYVESWETVSGLTIGAGITQDVYGTVTDTKIVGGGKQNIGSGGESRNGTVIGDVIYNGSRQDPFGKEYNDFTFSSAELIVHSGGAAYDARVSRNGELTVLAGGYVSGAVVTASSCHNKAPAYASRGVLQISDNYGVAGYVRTVKAENITISNGEVYIQGGILSKAMATGSSSWVGVGSRGFVSSATIINGARLNVGDNGSAYACSIGSEGSCVIHDNGVISGGRVSGGHLEVVCAEDTHAYALNVTIDSGGRETLRSGALASGGVVRSGGIQKLEDDAQAMSLVVSGTQILDGFEVITSAITVTGAGIQQIYQGEAQATTVKAGGSQIVGSSGRSYDVKVESGGVQVLVSGGYASKVVLSPGASQIFSSGGFAYNVATRSGATQIVANGAALSGDTVSAGVRRIILKGGTANAVTIRGAQLLSAGKTSSARIASGGCEYVYAAASSVNADILRGGRQRVSSGGKAMNATVSAGGYQVIYTGGITSGTLVSSGASQVVSSGGKAYSANILSGGAQKVYKNATAYKTRVATGGGQYVVNGGKTSATALNGGTQRVSSGGTAIRTSVGSGGVIRLSAGGAVSGAVIQNGGKAVVSGGVFKDGTLNSGSLVTVKVGVVSGTRICGSLNAARGAAIHDVTIAKSGAVNLASGAKLSLTKTMTVYGELNLSGASVNGSSAPRIKLASGAALSAQNGSNLKNTAISAGSGKLFISGAGNKFGSIETTGKSILTFNLASAGAKGSVYALSLTKEKILTGTLNIRLSAFQETGTYKLANNLKRSSAAMLFINNKKAGALKLGASFKYGGGVYTLAQKEKNLNLVVSLDKGSIYLGKANAARLVGGSASDIFYGGSASETIMLNGGKDTVVYDKKAWGKDKISSTSGTVTILFAGIKSSEITATKKGSNMIITRKGDARQSITVSNWNDSTHKIVYGGALSAFSKYAAQTSPTAAQKNAAANEIWKKSGLLA